MGARHSSHTMKTKAKHRNWQLCPSQVLYFDLATWKGNEKAVKKVVKEAMVCCMAYKQNSFFPLP